MPKCKICKDKFTPRFSSLQPVCEKPSCILAHHQKTKDKAWQKEKKQIKEKHLTHSDWENMLQVKINRITALIDKDYPCLSCNSPITHINKANAGHRFSVGSNNSIRFNLFNIWRQGVCCNKHKSGNPDGYDSWLKENNLYDYVHSLKIAYPIVKISIPELKEALQAAKQIIKHLEKEDKVYTLKERISLRHEYNREIGIYVKD